MHGLYARATLPRYSRSSMTLHRRTFIAANIFAFLASPLRALSALPAADSAVAAPRFGTWGFDTAGMDKSVRPGDDFYRYASGTWARNASIPPDRARYGSFIALRDLFVVCVRFFVVGL